MPNTDINSQKPYTTNQIEAQKPTIPRTATVLTGHIANSFNGGHNRTIAYKKVMAGEKHQEYRIKVKIKLLTPLTPAYQNLKCTVRSYYVPNSRVWTNAEKYTAQKGGSTETKINEIPNLGGYILPMVTNDENANIIGIQHTTMWRDSYIASYMPRQGTGFEETSSWQTLPKVSVLKLRGRKAIYNDFERNKEYDEEIYEYKGDTVTREEFNSYIPTGGTEIDILQMRARKQNSYYSNYWTEEQGFSNDIPEENDFIKKFDTYVSNANRLITWAAWESQIAEARSQAENAQKNDWDIIAQIRGSKKLTEGKTQLIGEKTFNLNYAAITQNAYSSDSNIREDFRVLGQQGAYSYTEVDLPCYAGMIFNEEGYVHVIMTVSADTVYETGYDRNEINITPLSEYRPDMLNDKYDVLYQIEQSTAYTIDEDQDYQEKIVGFKRKYSELFKLPNIVAGDLTTTNYKQTGIRIDGKLYANIEKYNGEVETQKTYQFYETNDQYYWVNNELIFKDRWKDYTDLLINKNQAIQNEIAMGEYFYVAGNNQIDIIGQAICIAELPVDESIKHNYTQWGEH